jgi:glycosyltransferase involved in cell wall biosynthesis
VNTLPLVSVIVAGYNQRPYVEGAIASVFAQTYGNVELIVVDNGSTDGSRELLTKYEQDPRVRLLLHARNASVSARLNEAITLSAGDFVSILYADDYYLPAKIESQVEAFASLPPNYGVVYGPGWRENERGERWIDPTLKRSGDVLRAMFELAQKDGFVNPISPLVRRRCVLEDPFDEEVFAEGENIYFRLALTWKFQFLPEPLVVMREHAGNLGKAIKPNKDVAIRLLDKLLADPRFPDDCREAVSRYRGRFLAMCGWVGLRMATDPRWARACLISAIRSDPALLLRPRTVAGLALSSLPAGAIHRFNQLLNATRRHKETVAVRADYP